MSGSYPVVDGSSPGSHEPTRASAAETDGRPNSHRINRAHYEVMVARAFVELYADRLRYDHTEGCWYEWTRSYWRRDETGHALDLAVQLSWELAVEAGKEAPKARMGKLAFATAVERVARVLDQTLAVTANQWDLDLFKLGVPGGIVDLRTGEVGAPDPKAMITKQTAVKPAAKADQTTCQRWLKLINEVTCGDKEQALFLQRFAGHCLSGDNTEHVFLFAHGRAGAGKGTVIRALSGVMADYATEAAMNTFTSTRNEQHSTNVAMLRGKRLVTTSETDEGKSWEEALVKQITGGDRITARFMRRDFFEFTPQCKLIVAGNHKPVLRRADDGMRRRLRLVPFNYEPPTVDTKLDETLRAEWPGILRWMIDGCLDWQANGLEASASVDVATDEYFDEQNVFGQWLAERCDVEVGNDSKTEKSSALYASWSAFARAAGIDPGNTTSVRRSDGVERPQEEADQRRELLARRQVARSGTVLAAGLSSRSGQFGVCPPLGFLRRRRRPPERLNVGM